MELLTPAEMGRADAAAIAGGVPGFDLMMAAGTAVADVVSARFRTGSRVLVLAGPGNNGGDGFVAAEVLRRRGMRVQVMLLGDRDRLTGDAATAAERWGREVLPADPAACVETDVIIDGLFGAGLARPLDGMAAALVDAANASGHPIVAIDLPSGVSGETGAVLGTAIRATRTVTFFRRKPGHLLLPGRVLCGRLAVVDIGIRDDVLPGLGIRLHANGPELWRAAVPVPALEGHKYGRGHAIVLSGGATATGAARMAARAALRAGAGLVTVASPPGAVLVNAAHLTAIMLKSVADAAALAALLADHRLNAILLGPGAGVGPETAEKVRAALASPAAVVLDADALTSFAEAPDVLFAAIAARGADARPVVMTPHEGEFARLFPDLAARDAAGLPVSKVTRARTAATRSGAVVILKGADTVIASPDGAAVINDNAPPWLATAGSGDVLAGIVTALLAQGLSGLMAAALGVWMHGEAGTVAGPGLIAEDLPEALRTVVSGLLTPEGTTEPRGR
ncbi:NAD(P)H-hydrate dehydratase [Segnochrobactraceae bacterium EtOH-i3]